MWVLLGSLAIFFAGSMALYVVYIALRMGGAAVEQGQEFVVPKSFWLSTLFLVFVSALLHAAVHASRRNSYFDVTFRTCAAALAATLFLAVQTEAMAGLVIRTKALSFTEVSPYPFTMVLALLHALHVVAGMGSLGYVAVRSFQQHWDSSNQLGLRMCTWYWHFLDGVWLFMLASFYIAAAFVNV